MMKKNDIPVLSDLIEKGRHDTLPEPPLNQHKTTDLYGRKEPEIDIVEPKLNKNPVNTAHNNQALEESIQKILEEQMTLAMQKIKRLIRQNNQR